MRDKPSPRTTLSSLVARGAALLAVLATFGLLSEGIARAATTSTPFGVAYASGTSGPASGGTPINLVGNQFLPSATVTIGGQAVGAVVNSTTLIKVTSPALGAGALYDIIVNNSGPASVLTKGWFSDFGDVPQSSAFHAPVETIIRDGITAGCGGGNYCPNNPVTRAQMAVFLLKAQHGAGYTPPACSGVFGDVPCPSQYADWIEQLANEGITGGCGGGDYCPNNPNTRGQMAVFLVKTFGLQTYGSKLPPTP